MRVSNTLQKPAVRTLKIRDKDEEYFSLQRAVFQLAVLKSTPHRQRTTPRYQKECFTLWVQLNPVSFLRRAFIIYLQKKNVKIQFKAFG